MGCLEQRCDRALWVAWVALALAVGCGASPARSARPSAAVETALQDGARQWLGCAHAQVRVGEPAPHTERECVEYEPRAADDPEPDDIIGQLAERACRRWEEREVVPVPGSWLVSACGQAEEFWCGPGCDGALTCTPSRLLGRIDCAHARRG